MIRVHSVGPLYWGIEYDIPAYDTKHVSHAWLIEDLPPFRRSDWGCRIRIGSRALHLGRCHEGDDPHRRDVAPLDEIKTWRGPYVESEEDDEAALRGSSADSLRLAEYRRPQVDAGNVHGRSGTSG